jgi:hypothetical protein
MWREVIHKTEKCRDAGPGEDLTARHAAGSRSWRIIDKSDEKMTEIFHEPLCRLSVIVTVPSFPPANRRAQAERAIHSILKQPDPIGTELILAESGSREETLDYFKMAFAEEVRAGRLQIPDLKAAHEAAQGARGAFLAFVACEDSWQPSRLSALAPALAGHDLIVGTEPGLSGAGADFVQSFMAENFVRRSSIVVRRTLFDELGGWPEGIFRNADYEFCLRALAHLVHRGERDRFAVARPDDVIVEKPTLPAEIDEIQAKVDLVRETLSLVRVARKLPARYWPAVARRLGDTGKSLIQKKKRNR